MLFKVRVHELSVQFNCVLMMVFYVLVRIHTSKILLENCHFSPWKLLENSLNIFLGILHEPCLLYGEEDENCCHTARKDRLSHWVPLSYKHNICLTIHVFKCKLITYCGWNAGVLYLYLNSKTGVFKGLYSVRVTGVDSDCNSACSLAQFVLYKLSH